MQFLFNVLGVQNKAKTKLNNIMIIQNLIYCTATKSSMSLLLILVPKAKLQQCILNLKLKVEHDNDNDKSNLLRPYF